MPFAPAALVPAQPPTALPYGLFSVLTPRPVGDGRWQSGIEWETLGCGPISGIGNLGCVDDADPATEPIGLPKEFEGAGPLGEAAPFTVYGSYACTPTGNTIQYAQDRATERLLAREETRVERALWSGDLFPDGIDGFTTGAEQVATGVSVRVGIGLLEDWIAENVGALGVLHMPRSVALVGAAVGALDTRGSSLYTALGTPVVAGGGYPGTGPDGTEPADGAGFIYATPPLLGYRTEPFPGTDPVEAGFDPRSNSLFAVTERTYVIGYDPCGTAVVGVNLT